MIYIKVTTECDAYYFKVVKGAGVIRFDKVLIDSKVIELTESDMHRFIDSINKIEYCNRVENIRDNKPLFEKEWCGPENWHKLLSCYISHFGIYGLSFGLSKATKSFLTIGSNGSWNADLYKAVKDMQVRLYTRDQIISILESSSNPDYKGRLDSSDMATINSALKTPPKYKPQESNKLVYNVHEKYKKLKDQELISKISKRLEVIKGLSEAERANLEQKANLKKFETINQARYYLEFGTDEELDLLLISRQYDLKELLKKRFFNI